MHCSVLKYTALNFIINVTLCTSLGISSKLDLDSLKSSSKLVGTSNKHKSISYTNVKNDYGKPKDQFEEIGVVCLSSKGCNTSQPNESKDSIQTDVTVHIKTNIELNNNNKSISVDDTPDVPVIIGTSSQNFADNQETIHPTPPVLTRVTSLVGSQGEHSENVYKQNANYYPSTDKLVGLNIQTFPSETVKMTNGRVALENRYKSNTIAVHIPNFESPYHSHYFGEDRPPQVIWYPKTNEHNSQPMVKSSFWPVGALTPPTQKHHLQPGRSCSCQNQVPSGLQWYPRREIYNVDPGSQINDKLSPLD